MAENQDRPIRLSRLNIFLFDFQQARQFADYILRRNLHSFKNPQSRAKLIHLAFNTSLIISYCRPFHGSNDQKGAAKVSLKAHVVAVLNADESALHDRIIEKRDQAFAHSDSIAHEMGGDYSGRNVMLYKIAYDPLTKDETQALRRMIKKWIEHLEELREKVRLSSGQESSQTT